MAPTLSMLVTVWGGSMAVLMAVSWVLDGKMASKASGPPRPGVSLIPFLLSVYWASWQVVEW